MVEILFELAFELVFGAVVEGVKSYTGNIEINSLQETFNQESYISGLIATAIAISYADNHKLDKQEKKMINNLMKKYKHDLSKKTKKNIKYIRRHKISMGNLNLIYVKLNIDYYMVNKITYDIERILRYSDKDISKQLKFINEIRNDNENN